MEKEIFLSKHGFKTTAERSELMKKIRAEETKPEIVLRKALWNLGRRYRKNLKTLPGKPDIALKKYQIAIFVDGEFWHGKNWEIRKREIKRNREYWIPKIERNMARDQENNQKLKNSGWLVLRFWSKDVLHRLDECVELIEQAVEARKN
jgi:DNA mismatch endonuclease, patch repair protein